MSLRCDLISADGRLEGSGFRVARCRRMLYRDATRTVRNLRTPTEHLPIRAVKCFPLPSSTMDRQFGEQIKEDTTRGWR